MKKQFETFKNDREFKPRWREERAPTITFMSSSYFMNMNSNIKGATYKNVNENIHELTRIINKMWKNTSPYVMMSKLCYQELCVAEIPNEVSMLTSYPQPGQVQSYSKLLCFNTSLLLTLSSQSESLAAQQTGLTATASSIFWLLCRPSFILRMKLTGGDSHINIVPLGNIILISKTPNTSGRRNQQRRKLKTSEKKNEDEYCTFNC